MRNQMRLNEVDESNGKTPTAVERGVKPTTAASKVSADPVMLDGFSFMAKSAISKRNIAYRDRKSFIV